MTTTDRAGLMMKYFVMKPAGADAYADASRAGLHAYATAIQSTNPVLAQELREWAYKEYQEAVKNGWEPRP